MAIRVLCRGAFRANPFTRCALVYQQFANKGDSIIGEAILIFKREFKTRKIRAVAQCVWIHLSDGLCLCVFNCILKLFKITED